MALANIPDADQLLGAPTRNEGTNEEDVDREERPSRNIVGRGNAMHQPKALLSSSPSATFPWTGPLSKVGGYNYLIKGPRWYSC